MEVQAQAWISGEDSDEYWAEGASCRIRIDATDVDEVRVAIFLTGEETETVCAYVSRESADRLARFLAAASVTPVLSPIGSAE